MRTLLIVFLIGILNYSLFAEELIKRGDRRAVVSNNGKLAAKTLKIALKKNLKEKMEKEGPLGALSFCANSAQSITDMVNRDAKKGVRVKRVSEKYRNPLNKPDNLDNLAFQFFQKMKDRDGVYPDDFITRLRHKEDKNIEIFRYYEPLFIEKPCLACHGEKLKPEVAAQLKELYPNDMATGYKLGDLRGLIAVEVTPDALVIKK